MSPENKIIPEWARQERQKDLEWIRANADIFQVASKVAFTEAGRGALVIDTTTQPSPDAGYPFGYFVKDTLHEDFDDDTNRMVAEYDPSQEFVVVLLKPENRTSTYRIKAQLKGDHKRS